jgi:putative addiction module component (TIGR02574 family)
LNGNLIAKQRDFGYNQKSECIPAMTLDLTQLSVSEKLSLIADLWQDIEQHPEAVPVPDWHKTELDKRLAERRQNSAAGRPWAEVKGRLSRQHGA